MRHPNIVKKALEHYILFLESVPSESEKKAEARWDAKLAAEALKSMDERVSHVRLLDRFGGHWLGQIRSWMQHKAHNGETVTWGSNDVLEFHRQFSVKDFETLAARIAELAINEDRMGERFHES